MLSVHKSQPHRHEERQVAHRPWAPLRDAEWPPVRPPHSASVAADDAEILHVPSVGPHDGSWHPGGHQTKVQRATVDLIKGLEQVDSRQQSRVPRKLRPLKEGRSGPPSVSRPNRRHARMELLPGPGLLPTPQAAQPDLVPGAVQARKKQQPAILPRIQRQVR
eukprot:13439956-Alexandrium_andersonii.AAC.1